MDQIEADRFRLLIKCTNDTLASWLGDNLGSETALGAFQSAIHDFKLLAGSPFQDRLTERLSYDAALRTEEARDTLYDPDRFLRFLAIEKAILTKAGVTDLAADLLTLQMATISSKAEIDETITQFGKGKRETLGNLSIRLGKVLEEVERVGSDIDRRNIALEGALQIGGWAVAVVGSSSFVGKVSGASNLSRGSLTLLPVALGKELMRKRII